MKDKIEDGSESAAPVPTVSQTTHGATHWSWQGGFTQRQYAAIHLKVPQSGLPWLDEMIEQARRDAFAGQALAGSLASQTAESHWAFAKQASEPYDGKAIAGIARLCFELADAMLEARRSR
jgi:hypothetical protein